MILSRFEFAICYDRYLELAADPKYNEQMIQASSAASFSSQQTTALATERSESIESALRRFKRKVQTEEIIKDVKRHSFYLKPGEKRRVKQALARKRARKRIRKDSGS